MTNSIKQKNKKNCHVKYFILSTDSDYLLNLCNKQIRRLTTSPAQPTSAWGHFSKMLDWLQHRLS